MTNENPMSRLDWAIIAIYLIAVVGLGVVAGFMRRNGECGGEPQFRDGNLICLQTSANQLALHSDSGKISA